MKCKVMLPFLIAATLAACGGGGGGGDEDKSAAETPVSGGTGNDSSGSPPVPGTTDNNPLKLEPAPVFNASARTVTYDDCFPRHDDVLAGDVLVGTVEDFDRGSFTVRTVTTTTSAVAPYGQDGVRITTDTPPMLLPTTPPSLVSGVVVESFLQRGSTHPLRSSTYNTPNVITTVTNYTPLQIGDISAGHTLISYRPGDGVESTYNMDFQHILIPELNRQSTLTEKITFLGVEEGTTVPAGSFPYTCVFRHEVSTASGRGVSDLYVHKWGTVKRVHYNERAPRPLIEETVSDTAIERRMKAPQ